MLFDRNHPHARIPRIPCCGRLWSSRASTEPPRPSCPTSSGDQRPVSLQLGLVGALSAHTGALRASFSARQAAAVNRAIRSCVSIRAPPASVHISRRFPRCDESIPHACAGIRLTRACLFGRFLCGALRSPPGTRPVFGRPGFDLPALCHGGGLGGRGQGWFGREGGVAAGSGGSPLPPLLRADDIVSFFSRGARTQPVPRSRLPPCGPLMH